MNLIRLPAPALLVQADIVDRGRVVRVVRARHLHLLLHSLVGVVVRMQSQSWKVAENSLEHFTGICLAQTSMPANKQGAFLPAGTQERFWLESQSK